MRNMVPKEPQCCLAGCSLTRRHHSPLPCDGARTPLAAVTHIPMTHLLPLFKSCWHWSHFDETLSILRQGSCVPSHTHPVSTPFPAPYTSKVPILRAHPTSPIFSSFSPFLSPEQPIPHNPGSALVFLRSRPALEPLSPPGSLWACGCDGEGCQPLQPTPQVSIPPCAAVQDPLCSPARGEDPCEPSPLFPLLIFHTCPESASSHPG